MYKCNIYQLKGNFRKKKRIYSCIREQKNTLSLLWEFKVQQKPTVIYDISIKFSVLVRV